MAVEIEGSAEEPLNREPDIKTLVSSFITPLSSKPYDRNHGGIPHLDAKTHTVEVDGAVLAPVTFTIEQLRNDFPQRTVIAAMQCAGNRRHDMRTKMKEVKGIDWFDGAVMNCIWRGPRLSDVLRRVGIDFKEEVGWEADEDAAHVQFASYETDTQEDTWYGGSIPLKRAMNQEADVLLAMEMNGEPLTYHHGFPIRVVVPGVAGARAVKWLDRITVAATESSNFYQKHDYKVLPPEATDMESADKFWHSTAPVMQMPVNSVVGDPPSGSTVKTRDDGTVRVSGYALPSGDGGPVVKVEVSGDEGQTWIDADLHWGGWDAPRKNQEVTLKWSWCLWHAKIKMEQGKGKRIWSRASDAGGNVQPKEGQWTLRGVCYNAYGEAKDLEFVSG